MAARAFDWVLVFLFVFACFIGFYYEPSFLYFTDCGWHGLSLGAAGPCSQTWIGRAWLGYLQVEPIYAKAPKWIQLVNEFDVFIFAWFYAVSVVVFLKGKSHLGWYRNLATFMAGMMTYSMVLYLTWQVLSVEETKANLSAVISYNGLWLFIFTLLMIRIYLVGNKVKN